MDTMPRSAGPFAFAKGAVMTDIENKQVNAGTPPHEPVALGDYRISLEDGRLVVRTASGNRAEVFFPGKFNRESFSLTIESQGLGLTLLKR
ncbi:hypothetical protein [Dyella sp.]|uniref:hypothetical protein n=1 Tax=Dyella sp. TaxID=1869338 RepID=UPI003216675A